MQLEVNQKVRQIQEKTGRNREGHRDRHKHSHKRDRMVMIWRKQECKEERGPREYKMSKMPPSKNRVVTAYCVSSSLGFIILLPASI